MKIYISGPISNTQLSVTKAKFRNIAKILLAAGWEPVNPLTIPNDDTDNYFLTMLLDIKTLSTCDAIIMLRGWRSSVGCRNEFNAARHCGLSFFTRAILVIPMALQTGFLFLSKITCSHNPQTSSR